MCRISIDQILSESCHKDSAGQGNYNHNSLQLEWIPCDWVVMAMGSQKVSFSSLTAPVFLYAL